MPESVDGRGKNSEITMGRRLFWLVLSVGLLVNGARLASSDEIAVYLLTESIVERQELNVPSDITPNGSWYEGRFYIWYEIGSALLIMPWYGVGRAVASVVPLNEGFQILLTRAIVSTMGAFMGAWLALLLYRASRLFGNSQRLSVFLSLGLVFSTFLFPYLKTILRDVPLAVFLMAGVYYLFKCRLDRPQSKYVVLAGLFCGMGFLTKVTFLMYVPMLWAYLFFGVRLRDVKSTVLFLAPILLAAVIAAWYNYARFGNPLDLGYHGGTSFPTPILTGLFGLLLSPGKGFFWFAPIGLLVFWAGGFFFRRHPNEALLMSTVVVSTLALYGKYFAWGGDGSWGPRYLVVVLPLVVLAIGPWIQQASRGVKRIAVILVVAGCFVQLGGISIYQGNYLRKIGEFPFTRAFTDREFMYKSHFIPDYSPIIGHWRMLANNMVSHMRGEWPDMKPREGSARQRVPLSEESKPDLLRTLDFWFTYAVYGGFSRNAMLVMAALMGSVVMVQIVDLWRRFKSTESVL